jgi:hypothetical protein
LLLTISRCWCESMTITQAPKYYFLILSCGRGRKTGLGYHAV